MEEKILLPDGLAKEVAQMESRCIEIKRQQRLLLEAFALGAKIDFKTYTFDINQMAFIAKPQPNKEG